MGEVFLVLGLIWLYYTGHQRRFHLGSPISKSSYSDPFLTVYMWINLFACRKTQKTQEGIEITRPCPSFMYFRWYHMQRQKKKLLSSKSLFCLEKSISYHSFTPSSGSAEPPKLPFFHLWDGFITVIRGYYQKLVARLLLSSSQLRSQDLSNLRFSNSDLRYTSNCIS